MDTKLTVKLEQQIIEKAKEYAKLHSISLSTLIENYLQKITNESKENNEITPLVKSLSGVINVSADFNFERDYSTFLVKKYK